MAGTLERKVVQPGQHPEVHPDIHPDIHPDVDELIRRTLDEDRTEQAPRRPVRWMRWLAAGFIAVVGVGVAIWALSGDDATEYAVPRTADGTERWLDYSTPEYAVPRTADGTERWLDYSTPEYAVPRTADGAVRWTTYTTDFAVPRTADGTLGWFQYLTPRVPQTADGTEGWVGSTTASEAPVVIELRPITQVPDGTAGEIVYLPVTPPRPVTPDGQVVLTLQPVLRPAS